jgi:hypothetical protein
MRAKWQEMFETYVQDRHALGIREKFKAAENLAAYKAMVDRMLTVIEKGYWQAAPETIAHLRQMQTELIPAVAAENEAIAKRAETQLGPAPGAPHRPLRRQLRRQNLHPSCAVGCWKKSRALQPLRAPAVELHPGFRFLRESPRSR